MFGERPAAWSLTALALAIGSITALPALYIALRGINADAMLWKSLWAGRIPGLLVSTLALTAAVTAVTIVLGVAGAWLVTMTDLPGKGFWRWVLALPLAVPPFIGALAYITIFGPLGLAQRGLAQLLGVSPYSLSMPSIFSFPIVVLILSVFTYPYVFMVASAALRNQNQSLIDAASGAGLSPAKVFFRVTLPLLRPSIAAGGLLVALFVLADFGAVSLMRYPTFTSAIYQQLTARFNMEGAAALSLILMGITLTVLWAEARQRARARYFQTGGSYRPVEPVALGRARRIAVIFPVILLIFSLIIPVGTLAYWSVIGISKGALNAEFWGYTYNSVTTAAAAATLVVLLAIPIVFLSVRHPGLLSRTVFRLSYSGYAIPSVLVGLGFVFFINAGLPWLYGSVAVLVLGYVVHYFPLGLQTEEAALSAISPNLEEAAHSFGLNIFSVWRRVTLPLMLPSLAAGWALVFISCMKELAATLLLRPPGFDTLAVRVWIEASEGFYELAAPAALLLVLTSAIPLIIITRGNKVSDTKGDVLETTAPS